MKKRSLIASIAMLLVSAIVLTSSTYAWFATGTTAKVSNIQATITNGQGSIAIAPNQDGPYKTTLNKSDFENYGEAVFLETLNPVSINLTGIDGKYNEATAGKIVQDNTEGSATYGEMIFMPDEDFGGAPYTYYYVYIKSTTDCTVAVTPTFGTTNVSYIYAGILTKETGRFFSTTNGRTYYPIIDTVPGIDVNNNGIMDFEDKAMNGVDPYPGINADVKMEATNKPLEIELKANTPKYMMVLLWAEGQDPACRGPISDGFVQFGIDFKVV